MKWRANMVLEVECFFYSGPWFCVCRNLFSFQTESGKVIATRSQIAMTNDWNYNDDGELSHRNFHAFRTLENFISDFVVCIDIKYCFAMFRNGKGMGCCAQCMRVPRTVLPTPSKDPLRSYYSVYFNFNSCRRH